MRSAAVAALSLVAAGSFVILFPDQLYAYVLVVICLNALLAVSVRLVLLVGEVTLATAAFLGIGAYSSALLTVKLNMPALISIAIGALVAAIVALALGAVIMGTRGAYFLLITFAFTEVVRLGYTQSRSLGGNSGIVGIVASFDWVPTLIVATTVISVYLLYRFESSRFGSIMKAIEGNTPLAECLGLRTRWIKTAVFGLAAGLAGLAGGLFAHLNSVIAPGDFGFIYSIYAVAWVVIGGRGHILGPVLGAAALTVLTQELNRVGQYESLVYGLTLMVATLAMPQGMWGWLNAGLTGLKWRVREGSMFTKNSDAGVKADKMEQGVVDR